MAAKAIGLVNIALMMILILVWGSSFVVVKWVLQYNITPIAVATFRFLVAGAFFVFALALIKSRKHQYRVFVEWKDLPLLIVLGLIGITFFFIAQYLGIQLAGASVAAILVCLLSPIIISFYSLRIFKEKLTRRNVLGLGIASVGTVAVIGGGTLNMQGSSMSFAVGSLILLTTPFMWAAYTLLGKKMMEKYDPFLVVAYVNILGALCLVPFSLAENSFSKILTLNFNEWAAVLYLAITCSLLGYFIWFKVLSQTKAAIASSFLFAEPLITVIFAAAFIQEQITFFTIIGGLLIFGGVFLVANRN
ncbi:MAG: DMT family transporter [Candidatus Bathyarchaeia archaeon]|jgi:drug/metabolite transporter (DMT)-like permease